MQILINLGGELYYFKFFTLSDLIFYIQYFNSNCIKSDHTVQQQSSTFLALGTSFMEDNLSTDQGEWGVGGFGIDSHKEYTT